MDDPTAFISQLYPGACTHIVPDQGDEGRQPQPTRRRRKKSKGTAAEGETSHGGVGKRKLSEEQVKMLEMSFGDEHKLESERKDRLALELGLDPRQVAVWFQNRRARWKNKKLEEEYSKLKTLHENTVIDKCRLESEVINLKEQLFEAEREIQRLAEKAEGVSNNSPTSSMTAEAIDPPFLGDFRVEDPYNDLFYAPENVYVDGINWMGLYV